MDDIAIRVENLSKQYRIGGPQARYKTIRLSRGRDRAQFGTIAGGEGMTLKVVVPVKEEIIRAAERRKAAGVGEDIAQFLAELIKAGGD